MRLSAAQGRALRLCAEGHGRDEMRVRGVAWWNAHQDLEVAGLVKRECGMPVRFNLTRAGREVLTAMEATTKHFSPFSCAECGGDVRLVTGPGRTQPAGGGTTLPVPDDFAIPTCSACGETYLTVEMGHALAAQQAKIGGRS